MYECESWTVKKAKHWRTDAFELWHWRRLLRVPWTARRSNQSIPKEISPEYTLERLMLKLKLQIFGYLMRRTDSLEKTRCWERLKVGGQGDNRGWDGWMASPPWWAWVWASSGSWWWTRMLGMLHPWGHKESDTTERVNWTENCYQPQLRRQREGGTRALERFPGAGHSSLWERVWHQPHTYVGLTVMFIIWQCVWEARQPAWH